MIDYDKVLITGGKRSCWILCYWKTSSLFKKVNLLNYDETLSYMQENKIEYVVHCAARVGGVKENMEKLGGLLLREHADDFEHH